MKRIFLVSCYIIASVAMPSCTNDDVESTPKTQKQQVNADVQIDDKVVEHLLLLLNHKV